MSNVLPDNPYLNPEQSPLLEIKNLKVHYPISSGVFNKPIGWVKAVDDVSFKIHKGTTVGLVGESGSGKTTIGRSIIKLSPITSGKIIFEDKNISKLSDKAFFPYRKNIQMIFQDPFNSLNPRMTILQILSEPLDIHFKKWSKEKKLKRTKELLERVGLPEDSLERYPHEFSGGQRQRIGVARALAVEADFIICDEAVSALDVSVQAQIVNLLKDLQEELNLTYLFIAHDLAIVEYISDYVLVMEKGILVEQATSEEIYKSPKNEYTQKLINAIPGLL